MRDEVAARRIERIEEHAGLAGQRPAIAREHLLAAVREAAQEHEVQQRVAPRRALARRSRGWCSANHSSERVEGVHRLERMHLRVADDADRMRARRRAGSATPSSRGRTGDWSRASVRAACSASCQSRSSHQSSRSIRVVEPEPDRVGVVPVRLGEPELALDEAGAARRRRPASAPSSVCDAAGLLDAHFVGSRRRARARSRARSRRRENRCRSRRTSSPRKFSNSAAIDLLGRRRQEAARRRARSRSQDRCGLRRRRSGSRTCGCARRRDARAGRASSRNNARRSRPSIRRPCARPPAPDACAARGRGCRDRQNAGAAAARA